MLSIFKLALELVVAAIFVIAGIKLGAKYPTLSAKVNTLLSWAKKEV
jgi:outer membrane murein-binding lipoprotein Lpp